MDVLASTASIQVVVVTLVVNIITASTSISTILVALESLVWDISTSGKINTICLLSTWTDYGPWLVNRLSRSTRTTQKTKSLLLMLSELASTKCWAKVFSPNNSSLSRLNSSPELLKKDQVCWWSVYLDCLNLQ